MIWNEPKKLPDGTREPRVGQPQSSDEYARWCEHFPDPGAPSTHVVVYRWEDSPNRNAPRQLVIDCPPKTEAGKPATDHAVKPEPPPANEARRKQLAAMTRTDLATQYGIAGLGTLPEKMTVSKAVAAILEAEAKPVEVGA
jgi:hypothetical protein